MRPASQAGDDLKRAFRLPALDGVRQGAGGRPRLPRMSGRTAPPPATAGIREGLIRAASPRRCNSTARRPSSAGSPESTSGTDSRRRRTDRVRRRPHRGGSTTPRSVGTRRHAAGALRVVRDHDAPSRRAGRQARRRTRVDVGEASRSVPSPKAGRYTRRAPAAKNTRAAAFMPARSFSRSTSAHQAVVDALVAAVPRDAADVLVVNQRGRRREVRVTRHRLDVAVRPRPGSMTDNMSGAAMPPSSRKPPFSGCSNAST
jgi:hypothetical protein